MEEFYGQSLSEQLVINRLKYKGRGRPRKEDYHTFTEAQSQINTLMNNHLDEVKMRLKPKYFV